MRKPNGYGSVLKLSGQRRKPYGVRITTGWTPEGKQLTKYIGYYANRREAEIALAEFNKNPYVVSTDITLGELFDRFIEARNLSQTSQKTYRSTFKCFDDISTLPISKLNLGVLQRVIDLSDKNKPTLKSGKTLLGSMFDYAIKNELLPPERKAIVSNIDLSNKENPNSITRRNFSPEEIQTLWGLNSEFAHMTLILLYTGLRISELLNLKEEDVFLSEQYFKVTASKTKAGIRTVPIADKIVPLLKDYSYGKYNYKKFSSSLWLPSTYVYKMEHTPHDTRHTFISMLTAKEIDERIIKAIVGHSGSGVTEQVYTHIPLYKLLDAVNQI